MLFFFNEITFSSLFRILEKPSSGNVDFKIFELFFASDFIERGQRWRKNFCVMKEKGFCGQTQALNLNAISNIIKYKNQFSKTND